MNLPLPDDFYRRLAEDGPDAVIFADADGRVRFWNAAATRIFGFTAEDALGQTLDLIVPERQRARHWEGYNRVMAGEASRYGAGDTLAVPALRKDGSRISVEFTILPLHDAGGVILGIAAFLRDVTSRFTEMQALRRQVAELKGGA